MIDYRIAIVGAVALGALAAWQHGQVLRAEAALANERSAHARQLQRLADKATAAATAAVIAQRAQQQALAAIDTERTKERDHAIQENDRLRAAVRAGSVRLRIPATCPARPAGAADLPGAAPAAGLDAEAAELAPAAGQAVLDLRAALINETQQLLALQAYVQRVCPSPATARASSGEPPHPPSKGLP